MNEPFKREAFYWRAFALLALVNKRNIKDFQGELARCSSGKFVSDDDLKSILTEFYPELSKVLGPAAPEAEFAECTGGRPSSSPSEG
jgi:hypothetical protein